MIAVVANPLLSGKFAPFPLVNYSCANRAMFRGINEGRQAARDVDTYLMGVGTQLPKTGGIIQRAAYEVLGHPDKVPQPTAVAA